jgi:ATP synthase protein I
MSEPSDGTARDGAEPTDGDGGSFENRLAAARKKQGLDPTPQVPPAGGSQASFMGVGLRVGVELLAALVVGVGIGWFLDRWLHTSPLMLILFVLLGGAAGVANVWRMMSPKAPRS